MYAISQTIADASPGVTGILGIVILWTAGVVLVLRGVLEFWARRERRLLERELFHLLGQASVMKHLLELKADRAKREAIWQEIERKRQARESGGEEDGNTPEIGQFEIIG